MNIVVTTISPPTKGMVEISHNLEKRGGTLWVMGDRKGPSEFSLPNTRFFHIDDQLRLPWRLARLLPEKHYTRKNLGYLKAVESGADYLIETDDDNIPFEDFWCERRRLAESELVTSVGWCNVYTLFSQQPIWPRGLPLEQIRGSFTTAYSVAKSGRHENLILQGLADQNPDVDAVYRLTSSLPFNFEKRTPVALGKNVWCPFNSQNTTYFKEAFPLLYLPSFCTFRMTDIWRSFVAQRCLWEMDSTVRFTQATVYQERNEHNLLRDFQDEIPGYLQNEKIKEVLSELKLDGGRDRATVATNLMRCYEALVSAAIVGEKELDLVSAWNADLAQVIG